MPSLPLPPVPCGPPPATSAELLRGTLQLKNFRLIVGPLGGEFLVCRMPWAVNPGGVEPLGGESLGGNGPCADAGKYSSLQGAICREVQPLRYAEYR